MQLDNIKAVYYQHYPFSFIVSNSKLEQSNVSVNSHVILLNSFLACGLKPYKKNTLFSAKTMTMIAQDMYPLPATKKRRHNTANICIRSCGKKKNNENHTHQTHQSSMLCVCNVKTGDEKNIPFVSELGG